MKNACPNYPAVAGEGRPARRIPTLIVIPSDSRACPANPALAGKDGGSLLTKSIALAWRDFSCSA